jgi:hypothetical protein
MLLWLILFLNSFYILFVLNYRRAKRTGGCFGGGGPKMCKTRVWGVLGGYGPFIDSPPCIVYIYMIDSMLLWMMIWLLLSLASFGSSCTQAI